MLLLLIIVQFSVLSAVQSFRCLVLSVLSKTVVGIRINCCLSLSRGHATSRAFINDNSQRPSNSWCSDGISFDKFHHIFFGLVLEFCLTNLLIPDMAGFMSKFTLAEAQSSSKNTRDQRNSKISASNSKLYLLWITYDDVSG
jgi:hypothetical protein